MSAPLVYTVHWNDDKRRWEVWKNGALTRKPSRVFARKKPAVDHALDQADRYRADTIVLQTKQHRLQNTRRHYDRDPRTDPEATITVEFIEYNNELGWIIGSRWDDGLLAYNYSTKRDATDDAKTILYRSNAYKLVVKNRQNSGSTTSYHPDLDRSDVPV